MADKGSKTIQMPARASVTRSLLCHGRALQCTWPSLRIAANVDSQLRLEAEAIGLWVYANLIKKQP